MSGDTGVIVYEGPSALTGDPIAMIFTGYGALRSNNRKIGDMAQAWILRADQSPSAAVDNGGDAAICGDCSMRGDGKFGRSCYVVWWQGPNNVYRALSAETRRITPIVAATWLAGQYVRLGAYGDPAAVPFDVWRTLIAKAAGWVGYTHLWRTCDKRFKRILMASVDNKDEQAIAAAVGWRTFRCRSAASSVLTNEVMCPASAEMGHSATCQDCQLCRGKSRAAKHVAIVVHGARKKWFIEPRIGIGERGIYPATVYVKPVRAINQ